MTLANDVMFQYQDDTDIKTTDKGTAMLKSKGGGANGNIARVRFSRLTGQIFAKLEPSS